MTDVLGEALRAEVRAIVRQELATVERGPRLYSVGQAAELLGVSRAMAYRYVTSGELRSRKLGGRRLVSQAALAEFIGDETVPPALDMPGGTKEGVSRGGGRPAPES